MFDQTIFMLTVMALAFGYSACAALWLRLYRVGDLFFTCALAVAASMLLASLGSAWTVTSGT